MRRSRGFTNARSAFTLIELLVVIAIIAILAAILFPVFAQARAKARQITCLSNLKNIGTATMMYVQDYDETFPGGWGHGETSDAGNGRLMWRIVLQPYIQKINMGLDSGGLENIYANRVNAGILKCPDMRTDAPTNYGYNASQLTTWQSFPGGRGTSPGLSIAAVRNPANLAMYADAGGDMAPSTGGADPNFTQGQGNCNNYQTNNGANATGDCGPFNFNPDVWREGWSCDWDVGVTGTGSWSGNNARRPIGRHNKMVNVSYADGHAKAVTNKSVNVKIGTAQDIWHNHD